MMFEIFSQVLTHILSGDFYVNQVLTGHGAFGGHHDCFFQKNSTCFCGTRINSIRHCLYACVLWQSQREKHFPRDYQTRTLRDLCLDGYSRKGVRLIFHDLLIRTLDRNVGHRRASASTRALCGRSPRLNAIQLTHSPRSAGGSWYIICKSGTRPRHLQKIDKVTGK